MLDNIQQSLFESFLKNIDVVRAEYKKGEKVAPVKKGGEGFRSEKDVN